MSAARKALSVCLSLAAVACGDGADPGTGTVEVTTVSVGRDVDPNGYTVHLAGAAEETVPAYGSVTFAGVTAGDHEVRLTGLRGNRAVQEAHPRLVRVTQGETLSTRFDVVCAHAPLLGRLVYTRSIRASTTPSTPTTPSSRIPYCPRIPPRILDACHRHRSPI